MNFLIYRCYRPNDPAVAICRVCIMAAKQIDHAIACARMLQSTEGGMLPGSAGYMSFEVDGPDGNKLYGAKDTINDDLPDTPT